MKNENHKIKEAYDSFTPTNEQKNQMLDNIKSYQKQKSKEDKFMNNKLKYTLAGVACCAVVAVGVTAMSNDNNLEIEYDDDFIGHTEIGIEDDDISDNASNQVEDENDIVGGSPSNNIANTRYVNYQGGRYVGAYAIDLSDDNDNEKDFDFGEKIGTVEIFIDQLSSDYTPELANQDNAGSFAMGSEIYLFDEADDGAISSVVVYDDGQYIVCEYKGSTTPDNAPLGDSEYMKTMSFETSDIDGAIVYDHFGQALKREFSQQEFLDILSEIDTAEVKKLSDDEYVSLMDAQTSGKSFMVTVMIGEARTTGMFIIPSLGLISAGGNYYDISPFAEYIDGLFADILIDDSMNNIAMGGMPMGGSR